MVVGNATNLDAIIDPKTYVTNARLTSVLNAHNTATNAHDNLFTQYLKKSGGAMTGDLKVLNKVLTDNSQNAANTNFVQELIGTFLNANHINYQRFKAATAVTFESDFSNPNAWWCKFPNGLIIQGGLATTAAQRYNSQTLPISFNSSQFIVVATNPGGDGGNGICSAYPTGKGTFNVSITNTANTYLAGQARYIAAFI